MHVSKHFCSSPHITHPPLPRRAPWPSALSCASSGPGSAPNNFHEITGVDLILTNLSTRFCCTDWERSDLFSYLINGAATKVLAGLSGAFRGEAVSSPLQPLDCLRSLTTAPFVRIHSQPRSLTPSVPPRVRPPDRRRGSFPLKDFEEIEPTWMMQAVLPGVCP